MKIISIRDAKHWSKNIIIGYIKIPGFNLTVYMLKFNYSTIFFI